MSGSFHTQPTARRIASMASNIGKVADKHDQSDGLEVQQLRSVLYLAADLVEEGDYDEADNSLFEAIEIAERIDWLTRQVETMRSRYAEQIWDLQARANNAAPNDRDGQQP